MTIRPQAGNRKGFTGAVTVVSSPSMTALKSGDGFVFNIRVLDLATEPAPNLKGKKLEEAKAARRFFTMKFWLKGVEESQANEYASCYVKGNRFDLVAIPVADEKGSDDKMYPTANINMTASDVAAALTPDEPF